MQDERNTDRGQVGIGTLIVFIAMVLVAAIAAGVLINTAGFLQGQSEDTGQESTAQVANNLLVLSEVGTVDANGNVSEVNLTVQKSAGSGDINLKQLTIHYIGPDGDQHLTYNESDANASDFTLNMIQAEEDDGVLVNTDDRYDIGIDLTSLANVNELQEGQSAELQITTGDGAQKTVTLKVPDSLAGYDQNSVVSL